ncbi:MULTISPECIES: hypothetical protein [unclassified Mycobacterium]|uniref:hypothetical protein n=1 Tax=unclassified Mycobacterium TaxID=2642494 RepID=UPI0029C6192A|nr:MULTISPECIES: hypothetical protein [unclassified Mycobacterium]
MCPTGITVVCSAAGGLSFFSVDAEVVGADSTGASSGRIEAPEVAVSEGDSVLGVDSDADEPAVVRPVFEVVAPDDVGVDPDDDEPVVVVPVVEVFAPPEADTFASGSEAPLEDVEADPDGDDESVFAAALDASADDDVESVVSALATAGLWVTAKPIPSATASTPTRPM